MDIWQQGKFGNPIGFEPKVNALRKVCQEFAPQFFDVLKEIAFNPDADEKNRITSAKFALEQAYGKSPQSVEIKITEGLSPNMMSDEQLKMYASGKLQELVVSLYKTGKLEEYLKTNQLSLESPSIESAEGIK